MATAYQVFDSMQPDAVTILLKDLLVDPTYQRDPSPAHVRKLATNWRPSGVGMITVNFRSDNTIALVDGQHRMMAALSLGIKELRAHAYYGLSVEEEAEMFLFLNKDQKRHSALGYWRAERGRKNPVILRIDDLVADLGLRIGRLDKHTVGGDIISCPDTLLKIALAGRTTSNPAYERLEFVLRFVREVWPGQDTALSGKFLEGVNGFLRDYEARMNMQSCKSKLSSFSAQALLNYGKALAGDLNLRVDRGVVKALQRAYDKGRSSGRLEPKTKDEQ